MRPLPHTIANLEHFLTLPAPQVSFEFFPPKTEESEAALWQVIKELEPLRPHFVSVTYGAGGTTRERTHHTVKRIRQETTLSAAAHLTCVDATRTEVDEVAQDYWGMGIRHIVALRGDAAAKLPDGSLAPYAPHPQGYAYAVDLVQGLRRIADFEISVAAYPETHPEAESADKDLAHLKAKIDAGATRAITQYFFGTEPYLRFRDRADALGIRVPIVPGILVVSGYKQLINFSKMCGATLPKWIVQLLEYSDETPEVRNIVASMIAAEQCRILHQEGIGQFHFYTLNRSVMTRSICRILGIK